MFRFTSEPEGSVDTLSPGSTETVWIWFDFDMFFLPESASDEVVGHRDIIHIQGPCHVEMVGSACPTGGRSPAAFFRGFFFSRLDQDILVVDDYGYAGIDFRHDPDLVLPEGEDWDASLDML